MKRRNKRLAVFGAMVLCISISSCTVDNFRDEPASRPRPTSPVPSAASKTLSVDEAFKLLTPAQHLAIAKRDYEKSFFVARKHLEAIPKGAPEYAQVPTLRRQIDAAEHRKLAADAKAAAAAAIERNPLEIVGSAWNKGGFGSVALWTVIFRNRSKKPVGNIKYKTTYYSETGNEVDHGGIASAFGSQRNTIQRVIPRGGSRTLEINDGFVSNQAHRGTFELAGWEYVEDRR